MDVNGIDLHVTEAGEGAPVLLIHGVTVDATFEEREISALSQGFRVVAPDLRGHGRSSRPEAYTLADHVQDMLGLLDALGIETTAVVGVSMGSYVAQALAIAAPQRVSRLVLVVSKSNGLTSSTDLVLAEHADELAGMTREEQQMWLNVKMFAPGTEVALMMEAGEHLAARKAAGFGQTDAQLTAANDALRDFDFRESLPSLHIPTLVISGRHDILNPPAEGEELVRLLPEARLEVFENSGHLLTWEEPEHFADSVRAFLSAA